MVYPFCFAISVFLFVACQQVVRRYTYVVHFMYLGCELRKNREYEEVSETMV
jgi:hypothetical protein